MAFSVTADAGCGTAAESRDTGGKGAPEASVPGWMAYDRIWWGKDKYAVTLGGGKMNNPGRYLTLLPPINGADAISGSPLLHRQSWGQGAHVGCHDYFPLDAQTVHHVVAGSWIPASDCAVLVGPRRDYAPGGNTGAPSQSAASREGERDASSGQILELRISETCPHVIGSPAGP